MSWDTSPKTGLFYVFVPPAILICNKIKNYLQKRIHKNVEVFYLRNHQTNPISRLLIHSWWSETQTILTCTSHWPICNSAKLNLYQFPLCRVASQLDVVTLSSNVFPSYTIQNNCWKFFYLDSHFAKAGRRLGPVHMEVGVHRWVRWPA